MFDEDLFNMLSIRQNCVPVKSLLGQLVMGGMNGYSSATCIADYWLTH